MNDSLSKKQISASLIEWCLAILLTAGAVALHIVNALHAGGLWRDEASTVLMAKLPSYAEIYKNLQFDSFPILWFVFLRSALHLGFDSDAGLRFLGLLVGLASIAMVWFAARKLSKSPPLISLVLIGFSPIFIRWGDSIRGTGIGLVFGLALAPLIWRIIQNPNKKTILIAFFISLLAVQINYYNCVLLFASIVAGVLICLFHRNFKKSAILLSIGILCALSMAIYIPSMREASEWNMILKYSGFNFHWFLKVLSRSAGAFGNIRDGWIWIILLLIASILSLLKIDSQQKPDLSNKSGILSYLWICLIINFIAYYLFLKILSYETNAWYFIPLLGFSAILIDAILFKTIFDLQNERIRIVVTCLIPLIIVLLWLPISCRAILERMTSIKSIAQYLSKTANRDDFIVVTNSEYMKTFGYYYHGAARWNTIPPLAENKNALFKNLKVLQESIARKDPQNEINPILETINLTLRNHGKVWLVDRIALPESGEAPFLIGAAPNPIYHWKVGPYKKMWLEILGLDITQHAKNIHGVIFEKPIPTSGYENPPLFLIDGYRP